MSYGSSLESAFSDIADMQWEQQERILPTDYLLTKTGIGRQCGRENKSLPQDFIDERFPDPAQLGDQFTYTASTDKLALAFRQKFQKTLPISAKQYLVVSYRNAMSGSNMRFERGIYDNGDPYIELVVPTLLLDHDGRVLTKHGKEMLEDINLNLGDVLAMSGLEEFDQRLLDTLVQHVQKDIEQDKLYIRNRCFGCD